MTCSECGWDKGHDRECSMPESDIGREYKSDHKGWADVPSEALLSCKDGRWRHHGWRRISIKDRDCSDLVILNRELFFELLNSTFIGENSEAAKKLSLIRDVLDGLLKTEDEQPSVDG